MRVLHVDPERGWGGGQVQVLGLLAGLQRRGVSVQLAADPTGRLASAAAAAGIEVRPLRIRNHADLLAGVRLRRLVGDADLVHFHTARAHALAPCCAGRPRVVTRRMDYVPRGGVYVRWLYNRSVDRVIAISHGVRRALVAAGVEPSHIRVVPSGVEPTRFLLDDDVRARQRAAWGLGDEAVAVVVVGVLETRKGHAILLDAARRLLASHPQLHYVFCGDGSARPALEAAAAPLGDRVRFAGFQNDVAPAWAAADIAVLPSLQEGLGVAALEAMASRRALVASRVGGLAEIIDDGESGLLVPPGDAAALAATLAALAGDPARRAALGAAAHARVTARYTMDRMAAGTLACYEEFP